MYSNFNTEADLIAEIGVMEASLEFDYHMNLACISEAAETGDYVTEGVVESFKAFIDKIVKTVKDIFTKVKDAIKNFLTKGQAKTKVDAAKKAYAATRAQTKKLLTGKKATYFDMKKYEKDVDYIFKSADGFLKQLESKKFSSKEEAESWANAQLNALVLAVEKLNEKDADRQASIKSLVYTSEISAEKLLDMSQGYWDAIDKICDVLNDKVADFVNKIDIEDDVVEEAIGEAVGGKIKAGAAKGVAGVKSVIIATKKKVAALFTKVSATTSKMCKAAASHPVKAAAIVLAAVGAATAGGVAVKKDRDKVKNAYAFMDKQKYANNPYYKDAVPPLPMN